MEKELCSCNCEDCCCDQKEDLEERDCCCEETCDCGCNDGKECNCDCCEE